MSNTSRRKAFGQNFLIDQTVIQKIVDHAFAEVEETKSNTLLEIGPGKGAITRHLLDRSATSRIENFYIVEMDRKFADFWTDQTKDLKKVTVISQDFLKVPLEPILAHPPVTVVSNLPYSSGTAILNRMADFPIEIQSMVLMFQKEVADRLRAEPDTNDWGSLSLWVQNRWDVTKLLIVPPRAFNPPPKVTSEVVLVKPRKTPRIQGSLENLVLFDRLLRLSFQHRRKMLRSSLPKDAPYLEALKAAGIPETERVERLNWDQWNLWFEKLLNIMGKAV
jgi:16S rRNA (adenine1518-N6/adenine1519-N6)-dimethyltransferase